MKKPKKKDDWKKTLHKKLAKPECGVVTCMWWEDGRPTLAFMLNGVGIDWASLNRRQKYQVVAGIADAAHDLDHLLYREESEELENIISGDGK